MYIQKLKSGNQGDYFADTEPFAVIGLLCPQLKDGDWSYREQLLEIPSEKRYPQDELVLSDYIDSPDRAIFLAYEEGTAVGRIVLRRNWNKNAFVEDLEVRKNARGKGLGSALLLRADTWAREQGLCGVMLETQDSNLLACRFYAKNGFRLGGVDTYLYRNFDEPYRSERAVFWYRYL